MLTDKIGPCLRYLLFLGAPFAILFLWSLPGSSNEIPAQSEVRNANDIFAELGRSVPEFGGMFIDEQQHDMLDVYVTATSPGLAARPEAAINAIPELALARAAQPRIKLLPARYSFLQLKRWHDRMSPVMLDLRGVVLTAIDHRSNRLELGVTPEAAGVEVMAALAQLEIPRAAVNFESVEQVEDAPAAEQLPAVFPDTVTLQSRIRPLVGGIQIAYTKGGDAFVCTLGFIAERERVSGFVTNSHCTEVAGGVDNTMYFQPSTGMENQVGMESVDPCYYLASADPPSFPPGCRPVPPAFPQDDNCGRDDACRYSDSAFATTSNGVQVMLGYIARPLVERSINWDPPNTFFKIVGEQTMLIQNTPIAMVGRTTGWRDEILGRVCANQRIVRKVNGRDQAYNYICQNLSSGAGDSGDSGSPVFICFTGNPQRIVECPGAAPTPRIVDVKLVGMRWGLVSVNGIRRAVYSPIGSSTDGQVKGVQNAPHDLGPLKKCGEGNC